MEKKTGIFICHCGESLYKNINIELLFQEAWKIPGITYVGVSPHLCMETGLQKILSDIKEYNLGYIVIAACSPVFNEFLFHKTIKQVGIDPQFLCIVNIREQGSWAHGEIITEKINEMIHMAVNRVLASEPIIFEDIDVLKKVLVIGGDVTGVTSALQLSGLGFMTTLLDKHPELLVNDSSLYDHNFKETRALLLNELKTEKKISVLPDAEVIAIHGTAGNFSVKIRQNQKTLNLNFGSILFTTGNINGKTPVKTRFHSTSIVSRQILNNMLCSHQGDDPDPVVGKAKTIAFVFSFSDDTARQSTISGLKQACLLKQISNCEIYILCKNFFVDSDGVDALYREARGLGIVFIKYKDDFAILSNGNDRYGISVHDILLNDTVELFCDLLVVGEKYTACHQKDDFRLGIDSRGFYQDDNINLYPVLSRKKGVFFAGECRADLDITRHYTDISSAVIKIYGLLKNNKKIPNKVTVKVKPEKCRACLTCIRVCPHNAIELVPGSEKGKSVARIFPFACYDCGICSSVCPAKAIEFYSHSDEQILAEIKSLGENRIVVFCCAESAYQAADRAGVAGMFYSPSVRIIRVPCIGRVDLIHILKAFEKKAKGVLLAGCPEGACRHLEGNLRAKEWVKYARELLQDSGINGERLRIAFFGHDMAHQFVREIDAMEHIIYMEEKR